MKSLLLTVYGLLFNLGVHAGPPERWDNQIQFPRSHEIEIWQGETIEITPRFLSYSAPWVISTNATVYLAWSTNNFSNAPWLTNGVVVATDTGRVDVTWTPACDGAGASAYQYFVGVVDASQLLYRAMGIIHKGTMAGKLNGVMPATTPSGWRME